MTAKSIATLVSQMTPPLELLNEDAIIMWRLEKAVELGAVSVLEKIIAKQDEDCKELL